MTQIEEITSIVTNGFVGTATPHYTDCAEGVTYIQGFNVRENRIDLTGVKTVTKAFHNKQKKSQLKAGDVLTVQSGHIGTTAVVPGDLGVANCHAVIISRFNQDRVEPNFVAYYLNSTEGRRRLRALEVGSSVMHINTKDLKRFEVPVPPLPEQRKIAAILSTWDEAIATVERLIAALERRKKGLMQGLLTGRLRFPEFTNDWESRPIGDFVKESRIPGTNGLEARKLTVRLYGKGVYAKSETRPGSKSTRYYRRKAGQFIYSKLDFLNGAFGIIPHDLDGFESTLDLPAFDIDDDINPIFLLNYVSREEFYTRQIGRARGGRKARRIPPSEFEKIKILVPTREEQDRISEAILTQEKEIDSARYYSELLQQQKKGLMQRLLTGQVRVPLP